MFHGDFWISVRLHCNGFRVTFEASRRRRIQRRHYDDKYNDVRGENLSAHSRVKIRHEPQSDENLYEYNTFQVD